MNRREIKVGLSISTSGKFELQGQQALNGILLWQSHVNANGGIGLGGISRPVRLIWYDDQSRLGLTRENLLRLLVNDCVDVLFGPYSSNLAMAAAEITAEHKKVLWNYSGTSDEIFEQGWHHIVGISSPASDYFRTLPRWLAKKYPDISRICVLYSSKGTFGRQVARGLKEAAPDAIPFVDFVSFDTGLNDLEALVSQLREFSPHAVIVAGNFHDEATIIRTRPRWPKTVRATSGIDSAGISNQVMSTSSVQVMSNQSV